MFLIVLVYLHIILFIIIYYIFLEFVFVNKTMEFGP